MIIYTDEQYKILTDTFKKHKVKVYKTKNLMKTKRTLGYVYQDKSGVNNIFVDSSKSEVLADILLMHEAGHIYYGHTGDKNIDEAFRRVEEAAKLKGKTFSKADTHKIANISMDLQINSTCLTLANQVKLENGYGVQLAKCRDFNLQPGLTYEDYLSAIVDLFESSKDDPNDGKGKGNGSGNGNGSGDGSGDGNDNGSGNGDGSGNGSGSGGGDGNNNGDKGKDCGYGCGNDELDDFDQIVGINTDEMTEDELDDLLRESEDITDEVKDNVTNSTNLMGGAKLRGNSSATYQLNGTEPYIEDLDALKKLKKLMPPSLKYDNQLDSLKIYNRKSRPGDLMYNSVKRKRIFLRNKLCVLIDVSSSMNKKYIIGFIRGLKYLNLNSILDINVVTWNTDKVQEFTSKDFMDDSIFSKLRVDGGTRLAPGVAYLNEKYKPTTVFIFTDLGDNLCAIDGEVNENSFYIVPNDSYTTEENVETRLGQLSHCNGFILYGK